jgi:hypothetical protein
MYLPFSMLSAAPAPGEFDGPGDRLNGDVECVRGECRAERAVVVALEGFVEVVMVRGWDGEEACWCCCEGDEGEDVALPCMALCALKAARKLARKGRWVGIVVVMSLFSSSPISRREPQKEEGRRRESR